MHFKHEYSYTKADFSGLTEAFVYTKSFTKTMNRISKILSKIFCGLVILLLVTCLVGYFIAWKLGLHFPFIFIISPVLFFLFCLLSLFRYKILGALSWKRYAEKGQTVVVEFFDDYLLSTLPNSTHQFQYSVVKHLLEDKDRFYVFISDNAAYILLKNAFTYGNGADFMAFMQQRTNLPLIMIK